MTTVLLIDDHELIRQGLARLFERDGSFDVIGQAGTVKQALVAWRTLRPDVVVTDLQLPDGSGLDVVRAVHAESSGTGVVVLTMHANDAQILDAMSAGASAFLSKASRSDEVVAAVTHAARCPGSFLCPGLAGAIMRRAQTAAGRPTAREQEVLELLADGLSSAQIAARLYLGESTVKSHIASLYQKLGATNRAQALVTAVRRGLLLDRVSPSA
jgi:DNA-binding NarL/FixJ family response regulator